MSILATGEPAENLIGAEIRVRVIRSTVIKTGVSKKTNRPYTLSNLHLELAEGLPRPIIGSLHTFDGFDGAEYTVTIEADAFTPGAFTVKKVRDAAAVSASRKKARAAVMGTPFATNARMPVEPISSDVKKALRNDVVEILDNERIAALENRIVLLEQKLELTLSLFSPPEGA